MSTRNASTWRPAVCVSKNLRTSAQSAANMANFVRFTNDECREVQLYLFGMKTDGILSSRLEAIS